MEGRALVASSPGPGNQSLFATRGNCEPLDTNRDDARRWTVKDQAVGLRVAQDTQSKLESLLRTKRRSNSAKVLDAVSIPVVEPLCLCSWLDLEAEIDSRDALVNRRSRQDIEIGRADRKSVV